MSASVKEKELRPTESAPGWGDLTDDPFDALRRLSIFRDLTEKEINRVADVAEVVRLEQDSIVPRGGEGADPAAYYFVLRGEVAFAEFEQGKVPPKEKNKKKRTAPTMQVARRIVALFDVDDFFTNEHVAYARSEDGNKYDMALFTCVNVVMLQIPKAKLEEILEKLPKVKEGVEIRGEEAYYRQTLLKLEDRADIFDFYVRQGFEYAQAIKIIQTDKCIDCDECVKGCEDRHGISRIERFGPRIGLIQFTLNCRTCEDARCITVCNFDAIGYDQDSEVIVYDNCVGCTLCAKACPHEAIRMVDIKDERPKKEEDDEEDRPKTRIAKGEEGAKEKKAKKAKRIANKCDHCFGFADMACISACPTGAIVQIDPRALFRRDGGFIDRAHKYFEPAPFEHGYSQTTRTQGVWGMLTLFGLATIAVFLCAWEYYARKMEPSLSIWAYAIGLIQGPTARQSVSLIFTPVYGFGRWLGYFGAGMMVIAALYTLRLHLPGLRKVGNSKTWFDFHVVFGLAGPILSLFHTDMQIFKPMERTLVTSLWWSVTAIVLTGLVGRYLYTLIPKLEATTERERRRLDKGIAAVADQWAAMTMSANVLAQFLKAQEKTMEARNADVDSKSMLGFIGFVITSELSRVSAEFSLRFKTMGKMRNKKLRRTTIKLMSRRSVIERRMQFYNLAKRMLAQWRALHIGISIVMFVLLTAHVAISVYAVGW
jgi:Fe-S-cluster-containing hydrogenase component 2